MNKEIIIDKANKTLSILMTFYERGLFSNHLPYWDKYRMYLRYLEDQDPRILDKLFERITALEPNAIRYAQIAILLEVWAKRRNFRICLECFWKGENERCPRCSSTTKKVSEMDRRPS